MISQVVFCYCCCAIRIICHNNNRLHTSTSTSDNSNPCHIQKRQPLNVVVLIYDIDRDRQSPYDHGQIKKDDNLNFEMFQWERRLLTLLIWLAWCYFNCHFGWGGKFKLQLCLIGALLRPPSFWGTVTDSSKKKKQANSYSHVQALKTFLSHISRCRWAKQLTVVFQIVQYVMILSKRAQG